LNQVGWLNSLSKKIDPVHSALLIVDMQNDFCSEGGFLDKLGADLSGVQKIVPRIRSLSQAAQHVGVPVVYVRSHFDVDYLQGPMLDRLHRKRLEPYCITGSWGAQFISTLQPEPADLVVTKHRYSAFYGTHLDILLRARGVRTVLLAGVATDVCVGVTGFDAFHRGYYVVLLKDACTAPNTFVHDAAVETASHAYAVISTVDETVQIWDSL
jgi:ureidoacrylate peracid hydrolase